MASSLKEQAVEPAAWVEVSDNDIESAARLFADLPKAASAPLSGWAAGRLSTWRSTSGFLGRLPYYAVPTSLSNDGFCSPQSSLTIRGKRRSLPAALPFGVVIDTAVCRDAPRILTLSGVGDLVAKFTAVRDWKLAFHADGEPVDDFAALLSDGSIHAYLSHPAFDPGGNPPPGHGPDAEWDRDGDLRFVAAGQRQRAPDLARTRRDLAPGRGCTACRSASRPTSSASCREHTLTGSPELFDATGFWDAIAADPFSRAEWLQAVRAAPSVK